MNVCGHEEPRKTGAALELQDVGQREISLRGAFPAPANPSRLKLPFPSVPNLSLPHMQEFAEVIDSKAPLRKINNLRFRQRNPVLFRLVILRFHPGAGRAATKTARRDARESPGC